VIERVPRERFVPVDQIAESARDEAIALDESGEATVSAMHAYARAFSVLGVEEGATVLDLGGGSGYGAAILSELVGPRGRVVTVEIDPILSERARALSAPNVEAVCGDAIDVGAWSIDPREVDAVVVGFALDAIPPRWLEALPEGTAIVAPIGENDAQHLSRAVVGSTTERLDEVRYVRVRRTVPARTEPAKQRPARTLRLPVVRG
jgi:protein-L-isoaspartate(D-aspartate) O-methyltransferase